MAVINDDGFVALEHWNTNGVNEVVGDTVYMFRPQFNVCLAWVKPEHVDYLLTLKAKICCNQTKTKYHYASENNVHIFQNGRL